MKILQLNVWTGRIKGALLEFFRENNFDIVCLQEAIWCNKESQMLESFIVTVDQIKKVGGFKYDSRAANWGLEVDGVEILQGNVILSKKKIVEERIEQVWGEYKIAKSLEDLNDHGYTAQLVKLENGLNVVNYHGYWLPTPVGDERTISAMRKAAVLAHEAKGPLVMCGDLNVIHASPAMRELDFLRDLTDGCGADNTLVGLKFGGEVACDHILVNEDVKVTNFEILDKIISDHKPLVAEIEL